MIKYPNQNVIGSTQVELCDRWKICTIGIEDGILEYFTPWLGGIKIARPSVPVLVLADCLEDDDVCVSFTFQRAANRSKSDHSANAATALQ
jgi:hypothetical protein